METGILSNVVGALNNKNNRNTVISGAVVFVLACLFLFLYIEYYNPFQFSKEAPALAEPEPMSEETLTQLRSSMQEPIEGAPKSEAETESVKEFLEEPLREEAMRKNELEQLRKSMQPSP